jgi:hypothetical protein
MRVPPNFNFPDNWQTMTEDEKHKFMGNNKTK